jgi:hypothetical protein
MPRLPTTGAIVATPYRVEGDLERVLSNLHVGDASAAANIKELYLIGIGARSGSGNVPGGAYEVTKQLPHNGREFEYRIKSASEEHERVALESELTKA